MALNPPVTMNGLPIRVADEFILLERDGIDIEVKVQGMSKLSAKGKVSFGSSRYSLRLPGWCSLTPSSQLKSTLSHSICRLL